MTAEAYLGADGAIHIPNGMRITLQRCFAEDWRHASQAVPRSYGRMNFLRDDKGKGPFLVPILWGESVWIGLEAPPHRAVARVVASWNASSKIDIYDCPPAYSIHGIPDATGTRPMADRDCLTLEVDSGSGPSFPLFKIVARSADTLISAGWMERPEDLNRGTGFSGVRLP